MGKDFAAADKRQGFAMGGAPAIGLGGLSGFDWQAMMERLQNENPNVGVVETPGYHIPQPSQREGTDFAPDSIAAEIYEKYGIIDPTATEYDRTSQAEMREDPYAHLSRTDPARQEYERWDFQRQGSDGSDPISSGSIYPERSALRDDNRYRSQLRKHKSKIEDILGSARGGMVEMMASGGLAQAAAGGRPGMMMRRGAPARGGMRMNMRGGRGMQSGMGMRGGNRMMRQKMRQKSRMMNRGAAGRGQQMRMGAMPGRQMMPPQRQMPQQAPGMAQQDAMMPGNRAMPMRGMLQKMQSMGRTTPGGNRVGMRDQQGGLSRAMQTQTGRGPISRRAAFPGSRTNQY